MLRALESSAYVRSRSFFSRGLRKGPPEQQLDSSRVRRILSLKGDECVSGGELKLHADEITQNGIPEKGLMDLTGKTLADYAHFKDTDILSAKGNDLYIHPDPLLNISGDVTNLSLDNSSVILRFASQPCR